MEMCPVTAWVRQGVYRSAGEPWRAFASDQLQVYRAGSLIARASSNIVLGEVSAI